jgi:uncharacterized membrane-anchored protein YhcB (DUF1043 family)
MYSSALFAAPSIRLNFPSSEVKQGNLEAVTIKLNGQMVQEIGLQKLIGSTLGESIYLYSAETLLRKNSGDTFEAEAKVIFLKVPTGRTLLHKIGDEEIFISWSEISVLPTEVPKEFIFGDFEVPGRTQLAKWLIVGTLLFFIILGLFFYRSASSQKKKQRQIKLALKEKILTVSDYQEVVSLWQEKAEILILFPQLSEPFKNLEKTLFKYQFKVSQTASERDEVMIAYRSFLEQGKGGLDGV